MATSHPFQFGRKRQRAHEKGKAPVAALSKRRGKVEVCFIENKNKRQQVRHSRKNGLFKKALEYATMTGDDITLQIRDQYYTSKSSKDIDTPTNGQTRQNVDMPSCSDAYLSPKAIRKRGKTTSDVAVQCALIDNISNGIGNDRHCRVCGKKYADYWLEAKCLLGDSKKITPVFCKNLPYLCPFHRK